jgi:hypothetical protein
MNVPRVTKIPAGPVDRGRSALSRRDRQPNGALIAGHTATSLDAWKHHSCIVKCRGGKRICRSRGIVGVSQLGLVKLASNLLRMAGDEGLAPSA